MATEEEVTPTVQQFFGTPLVPFYVDNLLLFLPRSLNIFWVQLRVVYIIILTGKEHVSGYN
jgi:hypothetical protein